MSEENTTISICPNGHQQRVSGSRFCIYCGQPLKPLNFQQNQNHAQQQPPQNQQQFNQLPVNNHPAPQHNQQEQQFRQANQQQNNQQVQPSNQQQSNQQFQPPAASQQQNFQPPPFIPPVMPTPPQNYQENFQPPPQQQYPQQYQQQLQPLPYQQQMPQQYQMIQPLSCYTCGGDGHRLNEKTIICPVCNWLRPLVPGYQVEASAFEWAADGKAMSTLRSMKTLNAAARAVSDKVGRRWIESTFNGVLLGEKQLPHIYGQAVRAARILGMSHMPDVYVSGERSWDCLTYGSDKDSFIIIGSALAGNFQGQDLLFLLAREMGHCRAGHALWKTVIKFLVGEQHTGRGMMSNGIFNAILNPTALIEGAIEMPLLAWARQAEITADRAGLLAVGDEAVVRRVLISWSLKSSLIFRQLNIEAWLEQQSEDDGGYSRLSELTTSSTPYIVPRLKILSDFAKSQELLYWRKMISNALKQVPPPPPPPTLQSRLAPPQSSPAKPAQQSDFIRLKCAACQTIMKIPQKALAGKTELPVKCPNAKCGKVTLLKRKPEPPKPSTTNVQKTKQDEENMNYGD